MAIKSILKAGDLQPGGHYALGTLAGEYLFVSGLLPARLGGDHSLASEAFTMQMRQVLDNLDVVLGEGGARRDQVAKLTIYIADIALWSECNLLCADYFGDARPARCIVPVPGLHHDYLIELEAIAYLGD